MIPSRRIQRLHFIGIGGAGMSGIAEVLHANGFEITGSDIADSPIIQYLRGLGIPIAMEHKSENVAGAHVVVYSSAVKQDNPEIIEALRLKIPMIRRAEMLGELMRLKYTLAIAGTHGKTTTTSMVGRIWEEAGKDPTVIVGGIVKGRGSGAMIGRGEYLIAEADEYDRSFLDMMPSSAIITNIDADHLDCYKNLHEIKQAFIQFANKVPFYGQIVVCGDDPGNQDILSALRKPVVVYGFGPQSDYRVRQLVFDGGLPRFEVVHGDKSLGIFHLQVPGRHNVLNAAAALALSCEEGIDIEVSRRALEQFNGVKRRCERIGEAGGILVLDDYAHHPTEVRATLQGIREAFTQRRLWVVFQPHLYSRMQEHYESFGAEFLNCDVLLVTDIYGAREQPIPGVSGEMIVHSASRRGHRNAHFAGSRENALDILQGECRSGDLVVFMGAGNIWQSARSFLDRIT